MIRARTRSSCAPRPLMVAALTALAFGLPARAAADDAAVGYVSLLIGEARVVHRSGGADALRQGMSILVGDRIETSANGHAHLRFVDSGAVSVRPTSSLEVQSYHYDRENPQRNEVRLKLDQGTSRSISGAATEQDKSRFRLNTPIAAIGIRGTDFIVHATQFDVQAIVTQGAISMAPLGIGCSATALGPCAGAQERVLSADMPGMMVQVRSGDTVAHLGPALNGLARGTRLASAVGDAGSRDKPSAAESSAYSLALAAAHPSLDSAVRSNDRAAADLLSIVPLGRVDARELTTPPDLSAQLVWGRWSFAPATFDNISAPFAKVYKGRTVTIGDNEAGLFRTGPEINLGDSKAATGRFDLRLTRTQADFTAGGGRVEAASVDGGTLSLDFGHRTFSTALALSSATGGRAELRAAGQIQDNGIFLARDPDQRVAGAVTADGREAGYLFERIVAGGIFRGKTLWGRGH